MSPTSAPLNASSVASGATPTSDAASTPAHELAPAQRQRREPLRVEGLVVAEPEHREDRPPERRDAEHDDRDVGPGRIGARRRQREEPEQAEHAGADRADGEEHRALADAAARCGAGAASVGRMFQPRQSLSFGGFADERDERVFERAARRAASSSGPAHAMRPLTITATWSHMRSTSSIT